LFPENLTWKDVERYVESGKSLVLIPVGSMEGHGYHLPLDTDAIIAAETAKRVASKGGHISFPPLTYTITSLTRPGNVELATETFNATLREIILSLARFGVTRFVLILGHGGPDMKDGLIDVADGIFAEEPDLHISMLHVSRIIGEVSNIDTSRDRHAGEWETSLVLYLKPDVVGEKRVRDFSFPSKHGIIGDPTIATRDKGEELTAKTVNWINKWIKEMMNRKGVYHNW